MAKAKKIEKRPDPRDAYVRDYERNAAEAERNVAHALALYEDDADEPAGRDHYATDEEYSRALAFWAEEHDRAVTEMAAFAQLAQVRATLALAAAHMATNTRSRTWSEGTHVVNIQDPGPGGLGAASAVVRAQRRIPRNRQS